MLTLRESRRVREPLGTGSKTLAYFACETRAYLGLDKLAAMCHSPESARWTAFAGRGERRRIRVVVYQDERPEPVINQTEERQDP